MGKDGQSNCLIRSLCKVLNKEYDEVYNDLIKIQKELNRESFNDIPVFESYMKEYGISKMDYNDEVKVKDLKLSNDIYLILCYDKKDFYHMIPIINNTIYDKNQDCMELYVLSIYKKD